MNSFVARLGMSIGACASAWVPASSAQAACAAGGAPIVGEAEMKERQVAALERMMQTVNAGDARGYASLYAEDARIIIHGSHRLEGRAAIERHEAELLTQFPGARLAFYSLWQAGDSAAVHYAVDWHGPGDRAMGHEGLLFFNFEPSGLIVHEHRYLDSLTPMAQLGALGPVSVRALPVLPASMETHGVTAFVEQENLAAARASLAALDAEDEAAFLAILADDVVLDELISSQVVTGKSAAKDWFASWTGAIDGARSKITGGLAGGEFVLIMLELRGTLDGRLGPVSASHRPFTVHRALIFRVRDGKLAHIQAFMNGKELAESLGQWPLPAAK